MEGIMEELKAILREIVSDLEQIRVAIARQGGETAEKSRTRGDLAFGSNREAYSAIRKRIDALKLDGQSGQTSPLG